MGLSPSANDGVHLQTGLVAVRFSSMDSRRQWTPVSELRTSTHRGGTGSVRWEEPRPPRRPMACAAAATGAASRLQRPARRTTSAGISRAGESAHGSTRSGQRPGLTTQRPGLTTQRPGLTTQLVLSGG